MALRDAPDADREYMVVPDIVKQFVVYLYRHIRERNIPEIHSMYDVSFPKLSDRYFKTSSWPPVELVADLVDQDHVFCLLYKELYYRHLYARTAPSLRARCESWDNYMDLFGVILHNNVNMQLPVAWLWEMVDEFVYQYQSWGQWRAKAAGKTPDEVALLAKCDKVWDTLDVLNVLQALVDKSGIVAELEADGGAALNQCDGVVPGQSNVLRLLGYFSLVGLLRVHCLVGDYRTALQAMHPLNPQVRTHLLTPKLPTCHITLYYYSSFAYMMLQRYTDAGACLGTILAFISRVKAFHQRSVAYDQMLKKNEQMYALLALCGALCAAVGASLDEAVATALREKHGDRMGRMARGEESSFEELFAYGCPKFITAAAPPPDPAAASAALQQAYRSQLPGFMKQVRAVAAVPLLKQHLLLYSSIPLSKLALLLDLEPSAVRTSILGLQSRSRSLQWDGGASALSGVWVPTSDIDVVIDTDPSTGVEMVVVVDTVHARHQAEVLVRHISKLDEIVRELEAPIIKTAAA